MFKRALTVSFGIALMLAHANANAANGQASGKVAKAPNLTISCAKECPGAESNDDAMKCAEKMEKNQGEATFKNEHRACYTAHEKYEKQAGHEEAGEARAKQNQ